METARNQSGAEIFHTLDVSTSRTSAFGTSLAIHIVLLATVLIIPLAFTQTLKVRYQAVLLAPPPPEKPPVLEVTYWKKPEPKPLIAPPAKTTPLLSEPLPEPEPVKPVEVLRPPKVVEPAPIPVLPVKPVAAVAELRTEPALPEPTRPPVKTNVFAAEAAPKSVTAELPARDVQTGGFGDPNGLRGKGLAGKTGNIASLGSFDLPVGDGAGNGTGGARGARAIVTGSGFGNASGGGSQGSVPSKPPDRNIRQGGFADTQPAVPSQPTRKRDAEPPDTPAEITFKPRPEYTEEARQSRLEGEVVVRVLFSASGETRVLEVVRGLGRGLDENAIRAAERIRFKPALRNKAAVDSTAIVHIVFQLAF